MSFVGVCDAWITELTGVGKPLENAIIHKYAPWSTEQLVNDGKRHAAIWPAASQPAPDPLTTQPSDIQTTTYVLVVWEDASLEGELRFDDDTANAAWLNLTAAIEARFRVQANTSLGETGGYTRLGSLAWSLQGQVRVLMLQFTVRVDAVFT
jgi:hypothetical protein